MFRLIYNGFVAGLLWHKPRRYYSASLSLLIQSVRSTSMITPPNIRDASSDIAKDVIPATVRDIYNLSSTVKGLKLSVDIQNFSFKAGQWVDFLIPGVTEIAGYSICSSPRRLCETRLIELAVKRSDHPPSVWIHTQCRRGSVVSVRVGGEFLYDPRPTDTPRDLLLVAGGVGINPLISVMRHASDLNDMAAGDGRIRKARKIVLAFSGRTMEDFIFKEVIERLVSEHQDMMTRFFITGDMDTLPQGSKNVSFKNGRIDSCALTSILQTDFDRLADVDCYVCGPVAMIDDIDAMLLALGLTQQQIKCEKWWPVPT